MKFDLEKAITIWRRSLQKQQGLEPGYIEEIESSLRDRIDDYIEGGSDPKEAFELAARKSINDPEEIADEYFKARTKWQKTPPWKKRIDLFYLLPNFLKVAVRNFIRKSSYSIINLLALALGILAVSMSFLYIQYETSFDDFHQNSDRIYRVGQKFRSQGYSVVAFKDYWNTTGQGQIDQIKGFKSISGVEDATQFYVFDEKKFVNTKSSKYSVDKILSCNTPKSFFNVFDFNFIVGNADAFSDGSQAVLTSTLASKIFGERWHTEEDVLSETVRINNNDYEIVGVIDDIPSNSHFDFELFLFEKRINYWGARTYLLTKEGVSPQSIKEKAQTEVNYFNNRIAQDPLFNGFILQPITSIHLESNLLYEMKAPGEIHYIYVFVFISIVIALITMTNYTNLSIAMNAGRNREIGMRKVMGASGRGVMIQFLMEGIVMALMVTPLVILLLELAIPFFNRYMNTSVNNLFLEEPIYVMLLLFISMLFGLLSGVYPAFYLSRRRVQNLFSKKFTISKVRGFSTRKVLITVQYILLIGLVSITFFINQQIDFIGDKDLGYRSEGVALVSLPEAKFSQFKSEILNSPVIKHVGSGYYLGRDPFNQTTYKLEETNDVYDDATHIYLDVEAIKAYQIKTSISDLINEPEKAPDEMFLINQTALEKLMTRYDKSEDQIIGATLIEEPEYIQEDSTRGIPVTIDGTFEDINLFSLHQKIEPYFLTVQKSRDTASLAIVQFDQNKTKEFLNVLNEVFEKLQFEEPLNVEFQEDNIASMYQQEKRLAGLSIFLSVIAVILAIVGLIALTAYLTLLKRKEIGIRKTLGASTFQIIKLFNKEYIILVVVALIIAWPVSFYATKKWLENFAYTIKLDPLIFLFTAIAILVITVISVTWVSLEAASTAPVRYLKEDQ